MPSMPGGDDKKEDDKAPETPEAKAEREQQVGCEEEENENRQNLLLQIEIKTKTASILYLKIGAPFFRCASIS